MTRNEQKAMTVCFTGHRIIPARDETRLKQTLYDVVESFVLSGIKYFVCGGALGFDMMAGFTVLELKKKYREIQLVMVLPCKSQAAKWSDAQKRDYNILLEAAKDKTVYVSEEYTRDCMFRRNRYMVDASSTCIAYCNRNSGGTAYTVNYAKKNGLKVILIDN